MYHQPLTYDVMDDERLLLHDGQKAMEKKYGRISYHGCRMNVACP